MTSPRGQDKMYRVKGVGPTDPYLTLKRLSSSCRVRSGVSLARIARQAFGR